MEQPGQHPTVVRAIRISHRQCDLLSVGRCRRPPFFYEITKSLFRDDWTEIITNFGDEQGKSENLKTEFTFPNQAVGNCTGSSPTSRAGSRQTLAAFQDVLLPIAHIYQVRFQSHSRTGTSQKGTSRAGESVRVTVVASAIGRE